MIEQEAFIKSDRKISLVWIFPILALLLGIWMVVHKQLDQGPTITVEFADAGGIVAGKTPIRARSVIVGTVSEVKLGSDFRRVIVHARILKPYAAMLVDDSHFWIVKPRIGRGGISGIGTILSGSYIEMSPGHSPRRQVEFVGLENPPFSQDEQSIEVTLESEYAYSISPGDPVRFRGFEAGRIQSTSFDQENLEFRYTLNIQRDFARLITPNTRFWVTGMLDLRFDSRGLSLAVGSLDDILNGGISFETLGSIDDEAIDYTPSSSYRLYENYETMRKQPYQYAARYIVMFQNSVRGLHPGAPVEYRGLQIGTVEDISINYVRDDIFDPSKAIPIPVVIRIDPGRFPYGDTPEGLDHLMKDIEGRVDAGLRANLAIGNLITGGLYINVNYYTPPPPIQEPATLAGFPVLPSIPSIAGEIEERLVSILKTIDQLPMQQTFEQTDSAFRGFEQLAADIRSWISDTETSLNAESIHNLFQKTEQATQAIEDAVRDWNAHSPAYRQLSETLEALRRASSAFESLSDTLNRQPNALIFPARPTPDPQPYTRP